MTDPFRLDGQRILVTGASSGIGRATAVWLSRQGAALVLTARDVARLEETRGQCHGDPACVRVDLAETDDIPAWVKELAGRHGRFSGLVHCAGTQATIPLRALSVEKWNDIVRINVTAGMQLAKGFRHKDVVAAPASIVFVSSTMARAGQPALAAYSASKAALEGMTRSLALELAGEGIRVNCVAPGHVHTPMAQRLSEVVGERGMEAIRIAHPLGLGDPEDVAYAIGYMLAPAARWITGTTLTIDGGYLAR